MTSAAARNLPELLVHSPGVREGIPLNKNNIKTNQGGNIHKTVFSSAPNKGLVSWPLRKLHYRSQLHRHNMKDYVAAGPFFRGGGVSDWLCV